MKRNALLILLGGVLLAGMGALWIHPGASPAPAPIPWIGFLVLMPIGLAILVWLSVRWAAMPCVIYGTVGLALDLATTVQIFTHDSEVFLPLIGSLVSGLLNFLLIVFGGWSFLNVDQAPQPLESRPPSPPSPV